jgi:CDP-diglyceride synthetase
MTKTAGANRSTDTNTPAVWCVLAASAIIFSPSSIRFLLLLAVGGKASWEVMALNRRVPASKRTESWGLIMVLTEIYLMALPFVVAIAMDHHGSALLGYSIVLGFAAATAGMKGGKAWGKQLRKRGKRPTPLAKVSPNKTWEGLICGFIAAEVATIPFAIWWKGAHGGAIFAYTLLLVVVELAGDLYQSWLKRRAGVKDTGTTLRGMGGIYDRIDGLTWVIYAVAFLGAHHALS